MTIHEPANRVLGLFAKWPEKGQVKTRLAASLGEELALQIANAFLVDTWNRLQSLPIQQYLVYSPIEAKSQFLTFTDETHLEAQAEGNLGQRLSSFIDSQFNRGASQVVVIGADSPTLPLSIIEMAFEQLIERDIVLGPATDGGFYLLGCRRVVPSLLDGIEWSSAQVLSQTVSRIKDSGCSMQVLPPWYDVDTLEEWQMLRGHLAALRQSDIDPELPNIESLHE